jgi:hypothetical protein
MLEEYSTALRQEHFMVEIVAAWKPTGVTPRRTGNGHMTFAKPLALLHYRAAAPIF